MLGAGACGAQLAQDARDRRERRRDRAVRGRSGARPSRARALRRGSGTSCAYSLGDLRAVGGAVQHELFIAARHADRLDVGDGVGGRVEGCASGRAALRRRRSAGPGDATGVDVRSRGRTADGRGRCRAGRRRSDRAWPRSGRAVAANCSANGSAACRAAGERDRSRRFASPTGARWRRIASVIVPGRVRRSGRAAPSGGRRRSRCCRRTA